jgi:hypothetical protein
MRRMRFAALVLVAVGAGYFGNKIRQSGGFDERSFPLPAALTDSAPGAVLSNEEAVPEAGTQASAPVEAKSAAPVPKRVAPRAETPKPSAAEQTRPAPPSDEPAPERPEAAVAAGVAGGTSAFEDSANEVPESQPPSTARQADVRGEAARALRELDRERQADRAAAATAALDSARRRDALARQAAAPPAPRTPEQRAGTYLRIGLDEAAKQLGRPVHVIEGRSALFMGLAQGRLSPGADATRPVVRVVYQDAQGRLILLDQQRLRPVQPTSAPGAEPHWTVGEIALHLSGEVGPDVLRSLRARVR